MKSVYNLYGVSSLSLRELSSELSNLLNLDFSRRESSYKGGEYFIAAPTQGGEILVESNWTDEDGHLSEPQHSEFPVLVYANATSLHVRATISGSGSFVLLRSEEL